MFPVSVTPIYYKLVRKNATRYLINEKHTNSLEQNCSQRRQVDRMVRIQLFGERNRIDPDEHDCTLATPHKHLEPRTASWSLAFSLGLLCSRLSCVWYPASGRGARPARGARHGRQVGVLQGHGLAPWVSRCEV